jgi:hypothetical protein
MTFPSLSSPLALAVSILSSYNSYWLIKKMLPLNQWVFFIKQIDSAYSGTKMWSLHILYKQDSELTLENI